MASVLDCVGEGLCHLCLELQALLGPWPRRMGKGRGVAPMGLGRDIWSCCSHDWSHAAASREWRGGQRGYKRLGPVGPTGAEEAGLCSTYLGKWMCVYVCVLMYWGMQGGTFTPSVLRERLANQVCSSLAMKTRHRILSWK